MNAKFALKNYKAAPIEWLIRRALNEPGLISLAAGLVDHREFPATEIAEITQKVLQNEAPIALQYTSTQGRLELRQEIAKMLGHSNWQVDENAMIIGTGSQQILDLIGRAMLRSGDIVLMESPSYYVYVHALNNLGVQCVHVPTDSKGMIPRALEECLAILDKHKMRAKVKMLYLIPYAHNPRSTTTDLKRKKELLKVFAQMQDQGPVLLLEDGAYRELCFKDAPETFLQLASGELQNKIAYLGSFSKALAPGFKTGYGLLPADLREVVLRIKSDEDFGAPSLNQAILAEVLRSGLFERQSAHWRKHYQAKAFVMEEALNEHFAKSGVKWEQCSGGLYFYLHFPANFDVSAGSVFFEHAIQKGVLYVPASMGFGYGSEKMGLNQMRLSFGVADPQQIKEGVRRLAEAFDSDWIRKTNS